MQDIQLLWGIAKKRSGDGPRQLEMPHISHHWEVGKIIDSKVPGPLGDMLMFLEGFFPYHDMYYTYIYIYLQIVNSISSRIHLICFWLLSWRGFWWICVSMFLFFSNGTLRVSTHPSVAASLTFFWHSFLSMPMSAGLELQMRCIKYSTTNEEKALGF